MENSITLIFFLNEAFPKNEYFVERSSDQYVQQSQAGIGHLAKSNDIFHMVLGYQVSQTLQT